MSTCRQRKVECEQCGCIVRMTRGWMADAGLPVCGCGGRMLPSEASDLAFAGVIGPEDMRPAQWTVICRENGWEDSIQRKGAAANAYARRMLEQGGILGRAATKPQCAYPGCGKWTSNGAEHCAAHDLARIAQDVAPF